MKRYARNSLLPALILLLFPTLLWAQENLSFRHIDSRQGLTQNSVFAIEQDGEGFMWFGTRTGLNRYDGYRMRTYERGSDSTNGLAQEDVRGLYYDKHIRKLWVCTAEDLCLFNPLTDSFLTIKGPELPDKNTPPRIPNEVLRDSRGFLWVATSRGLYRVDESTSSLVTCPSPPTLQQNFHVRTLYEDDKGVLWVGSTQGLFPMRPDSAGIPQYLPRSYGQEANAMLGAYIQFIKQDGKGRYWIGAYRDGLYSWVPGKKPIHYLHDPHDPASISDNDVRALAVDGKGRIWVGTFVGLNIFNEKIQTFTRYVHEVGNPLTLSNGSVRDICFDTRGSAWVGTYYGGVSYYSPESYRFTHHQPQAGEDELSHAVVSSFWEDALHNLWIGTEGGGLNYWNREEDTYQHFRHISGRTDGLSGNNIKTIVGQGDSLWIGTFANGLNLYRPSMKRWKHFSQGPDGLSHNNVYGLLLHQQQLWIVTYGGGLNIMDLASGNITPYLPSSQDTTSLISIQGRVISRDLAGRVWIGTNHGLEWAEPLEDKRIRFHHYLKGHMISSILAAKDSTIWAGSYHQGVFVLDKNGRVIKHYGKEDGLPGQTAFGLLEDRQGRIWISTEKGVAKIDRRDKSLRSYNYSDGLGNLEYNFSAYFEAKSGELFFGGTQGFTSFFPNAVRTNIFVPPVVFTHLQSANQHVRPGDSHGILQSSLNTTTELTFPYNEANFSIGFAALDFLNPANNHYAYRLEGLDQDWKYVQGESEVSYTLQRSGTYTFRLRGGNDDGIWNQRERNLTITVLPPPWRSPTAYGIYTGLFLLLLIGGYRFIQMRHRLQLEKLTTVQQEELHQAKLRFYTNVTHEFRTPLTLILGPIEDLMRKGISAGNERQLQAIQQNAQRLLRLVNQLLNFRSLEHDHDQMQVAPGNFVKFMRELYLSFQEQARIKHIQYDFEVSEAAIKLWFDRDKLEKVFYNLLSNAFKFTPTNGTIRIRICEGEEEVRVEVRDSGPGIPDSLKPRIFDRFVHQEAPQLNSTSGTGIGLALAKQLVEMHGGRIELGTNPPKGTCFSVSFQKGKRHFAVQDILPNFKDSENFQAYMEKAEDQPETKPFAFPSPTLPLSKLLIVEDNAQVRTYVQDMFKDHFEILLAENGVLGLKQARTHSPDLIISDIMMPEMDGINLCSQLKSRVETSHIPVILLTARTGQIFRVEGLETGADAYLTKPFSPYELQLKVHNLLETRRRIRDRFHSVLKLEPKEITVTSADEAFLTRAIDIVEKYMDDADFTVEVFAQELAVSRPLLFTKIKALTSQTPNNFVKTLRLKRSAQLLSDSDHGVAQIAYQVGFRDARYFSKCFQKEFEKTPSEYRSEAKV